MRSGEGVMRLARITAVTRIFAAAEPAAPHADAAPFNCVQEERAMHQPRR